MSWVIDATAFLVDLKALEADLHEDTRNAMHTAVEEAERHAKTTTLFKDRTTGLRTNIVSWVTDTQGELSANAKYARFIEAGTQPHRIVGHPTLRFEWKGVWVNFRAVNHPGTAPRPFMERAGEWGGHVLYDALGAFSEHTIQRFNAK